ncbi:unnamed protein product [Euphydryas editha]|uniref:Uncharacterized protein n=1 Tax=Euphydryas editha TaxID=104508 RepID=A0AAU9UB89_EUPED|nr:unnamed protein product [Euphydryas editha]
MRLPLGTPVELTSAATAHKSALTRKRTAAPGRSPALLARAPVRERVACRTHAAAVGRHDNFEDTQVYLFHTAPVQLF